MDASPAEFATAPDAWQGVTRTLRDLLVLALVFGSLPVIMMRPWVGVLVWTWISLMSPHRLSWGFAYDFPFAKIVGAATLFGLLFSIRRKPFPITREALVLALFLIWMIVTTFFALEPTYAWPHLVKVVKIQILVFVTMLLVSDRRKLDLFVWVTVLSIGFYGVKGGIFTLLRGGESHVFGPAGSFIEDNNHLGLALLMVLPLMRYLHLVANKVWVRWGLVSALVLTGVAALGTQSRGTFLALVATLTFMAIKSRQRLLFFASSVIVIPIALSVMPQRWFDRMDSIRDYQSDGSAMGRINAWGFAVNLATDRPLGGGFEVFSERWFLVYAPDPTDYHDAHSIYFEVLGEHGFLGLALFLTLGFLCWRSCTWIARHSESRENLHGLDDLARICQVSLVAYASAGAFVGLAYFDLYYNLVAIIVVAKVLVENELAAERMTDMEEAPQRRTLSLASRSRARPVADLTG